MSSTVEIVDRQLLGTAALLAEELDRRAKQERCLTDTRYLADLLWPRANPDYIDFWKRFGEPAEWLMQACIAWKARGILEVMPGFAVIDQGAKEIVVENWEQFDLRRYTTLLILQSRETLKTAVRRLDLVHDLFYYPVVKGMPCTAAWFGHKLDEASRNCTKIKEAMCASDEFHYVWGGKVSPLHRDPDKWNTSEYFNTPWHPKGHPEHSATFLAVKTRYEGGRYKRGHFDDLVTGDDRISMPVRESKKQNLKDRENERDKTVGIRVVQGTYYHDDDAYRELEKQRGVLTIKLPCLLRRDEGSIRKFFEFCDLDFDRRVEQAAQYASVCQPTFEHLDMVTLAETCDAQTRPVFAGQMLLKPGAGGQHVFNTDTFQMIDADQVPDGLAGVIVCDPAFKKAENRFRGDYNAIGLGLWDKHGRLIIADGAYRNDWGESEVFAEFGRLWRTYQCMGIYMENRLQSDINLPWADYAYRNQIGCSAILPLQKAGVSNKSLLIQQTEPQFRAGKIVLVRGLEITNAILDEAKGYDRITGPSAHDDALNIVAMFFDPAVGTFPMPFGAGQTDQKRAKLREEQEVDLP